MPSIHKPLADAVTAFADAVENNPDAIEITDDENGNLCYRIEANGHTYTLQTEQS